MTRKNKKSRKNKRSNGNAQTPTASAVVLRTIPPVVRNPIHKFRRALTRQFYWNPSISSIDGLGGSTMQVTFSPLATDWRIAGVSVYLDSLPSVSDFINLFDQWRLSSVTVVFDMATMVYMNSNPTFSSPIVHHVVDYDDPGDLPLTNLLQFPQARRHNFYENANRPLILSLSPRPLADVAGSGISTTYAPMDKVPFLRTADMSTPHYSLKFAFQNLGGSADVKLPFQMTVYYDLEFANPK